MDIQDTIANDRLRLAALGYHTLLVYGVTVDGGCVCGKRRCRSIAKHPVSSGATWNATRDADEIRASSGAGCNLAVHAGLSGLAIVDIDPRNEGYDTLANLELEHGKLVSCVVVDTGGGGEHRYFAAPLDGSSLPSSLGPGIDLISGNKYAIAPASRHASGRYYRWRDGLGPENSFMLTELPVWVTADLGVRSPDESNAIAKALPETLEEVARLKSALQFITPDCPRNKWRDVIYSIHSTGWSCSEEIAREWSMAAPHRWSEDEFQKIWSGAK